MYVVYYHERDKQFCIARRDDNQYFNPHNHNWEPFATDSWAYELPFILNALKINIGSFNFKFSDYVHEIG